MTFFDFNLLSEIDKMNILKRKAVLIAVRDGGHYIFELYQIEGFYVEQQVHKNWNICKPYRSFTSTGLLDPYLLTIDISSLVVQN